MQNHAAVHTNPLWQHFGILKACCDTSAVSGTLPSLSDIQTYQPLKLWRTVQADQNLMAALKRRCIKKGTNMTSLFGMEPTEFAEVKHKTRSVISVANNKAARSAQHWSHAHDNQLSAVMGAIPVQADIETGARSSLWRRQVAAGMTAAMGHDVPVKRVRRQLRILDTRCAPRGTLWRSAGHKTPAAHEHDQARAASIAADVHVTDRQIVWASSPAKQDETVRTLTVDLHWDKRDAEQRLDRLKQEYNKAVAVIRGSVTQRTRDTHQLIEALNSAVARDAKDLQDAKTKGQAALDIYSRKRQQTQQYMQTQSMPTTTATDTSELEADFAQQSALTRAAQTPREQQQLQQHMQTPSMSTTIATGTSEMEVDCDQPGAVALTCPAQTPPFLGVIVHASGDTIRDTIARRKGERYGCVVGDAVCIVGGEIRDLGGGGTGGGMDVES